MKASHRSALPAIGLAAALAATAVPSAASAQRQQIPGPDTKRVLITAFRGDVEGGVKLADEIRNRIASAFNIKQLMATPKKEIEANLTQSGYRADSALNPNDIKELGKLVRADEVIDGTVTKTAAGYRVNARMFLPRDAALSQPLVSVESANLGDVAKQVVSEYESSRRQLKGNQDCENAIRAGKPADAIAAARQGITAYPRATLARLCLASAYQAYKTTADSTGPWKDSVIAVTTAITTADNQSKIAYQLQYDAYKSKMDTASALKALVGLMSADPTNSTLRESVIAELVTSGKPEIAIPTARQLVTDNPGDPQYARTYWLVLNAARNYKEAVEAGKAYVALDSAAADSNYYFRQIAALQADSAYAKAAEFAATGVAKFPTNTSLLLSKASNERRAGQIPAAKASLERALQINPKAPGANMLLAQLASDAGNLDEAIKAVKADVAAEPTNKDRDAAFLLSLGSTAYKAAAASKKPDDFRKAITLLKASDEIAPGVNAKYLQGVSAFGLVQHYGTALQSSKTCADAKAGQDALLIVNVNMPAAGAVDANVAKQILGATGQYQAFFDASAKRYCK